MMSHIEIRLPLPRAAREWPKLNLGGQSMKKLLITLTLVWCAVDFNGKVYACFGYDSKECERFVAQNVGDGSQPLHCEFRP